MNKPLPKVTVNSEGEIVVIPSKHKKESKPLGEVKNQPAWKPVMAKTLESGLTAKEERMVRDLVQEMVRRRDIEGLVRICEDDPRADKMQGYLKTYEDSYGLYKDLL